MCYSLNNNHLAGRNAFIPWLNSRERVCSSANLLPLNSCLGNRTHQLQSKPKVHELSQLYFSPGP